MPSLYIFTNLNYSKINRTVEGWLANTAEQSHVGILRKEWAALYRQVSAQETMPTPSSSLAHGKGQCPRRALPSVAAHAHCFSWLSSGGSCGGTSCWILGCPCSWLETLYSTVETVEAIYQAVINIKCHFLAPELQFSLW